MAALPHRIVVVGGGYAGAIAAVRAAGRTRGRAVVSLVNPRAGFVQRLRLHQVATGRDVAAPELDRLCGRRVGQVRGWVTAVDPERGYVTVDAGERRFRELPFETLILATGSTVDADRLPGAREHAHTLSDVESAERFAGALAAATEGDRVAVVGDGLTGIEAATEIAEARPDLNVELVGREPFGASFSSDGAEHLAKVFDRLGIEAVDQVEVEAVGPGALELTSGAPIECELTLSCGGFAASPLAAESGLAVGERGRAYVDGRMRSISHPRVMVVGDAAECPTGSNGATARMSCQAGMPTGAHAADVLAASLRGREEPEFDFGYIGWNISLGRRDGLIQWVDRGDDPRGHVTRGRRAAWIKERVTSSGMKSVGWERRLPGALRWLRSPRSPVAPSRT